MPIPYNAGITTTHIPGYYNSNKDHLEYIYSLLADQESKEVMASRIRAIETGNIGYIKISEYEEYFHPLVKPENGDIVIDGGVSENIYPEICFINAVGKDGKIFGFEPDPAGFCTAEERIKDHNRNATYKLIPFGIWDKKETIYFKIQGQGTHVTTKNEEGSIACECISIDEFVRTFFLPKVDVIKLDVEGSEINAIKGAVKTILTHKPKLMVSLYHKPEDLFKIPMFIHELCGDYTFYMGHHHADLHETILYCRPKA
jgi:FkbM family methyltransferase